MRFKNIFFLLSTTLSLIAGSALPDLDDSLEPERAVDYPFIYPITGEPFSIGSWQMTNGFGNYTDLDGKLDVLLHHTGVDWNLNWRSEEIYAANHGVVVFAGSHPRTAIGHLVIIKHQAPAGRPFIIPAYDYEPSIPAHDYRRDAYTSEVIYTYYLHLSSELRVAEGDQVYKGQIIGKNFSTEEKAAIGSEFYPHLHFEIWSRIRVSDGETLIDPNGYDLPGLTESIYYFKYNLAKLVDPEDFFSANSTGPVIGSATVQNDHLNITGINFGTETGQILISSKHGTNTFIHTMNSDISFWHSTHIKLPLNATSLGGVRLQSIPLPYSVTVSTAQDSISPPMNTPFEDVHPNIWYADDVTMLYRYGVLDGQRGKPIYFPHGETNRAEFLKILIKAMEHQNGVSIPPLPQLPDLPAIRDQWFYNLVVKGLALSNHDNEPILYWPLTTLNDPNWWAEPIQRQQAARMVANAARLPRVHTPPIPTELFGDVPFSHSFASWIYACKIAGIANGDHHGNFNAEKSMNRAEAAKLIVNALPDFRR